ncbi:MAG: DUF4266 domain-containing protein [Gammaproteobacteria bacterium]|nr:DUF4266 domain-containing protein [Gammaproteobacteria bacterium]
MRRKTRFGFLLSTFALAALLSGCAAVEPWERGTLAKPQMESPPHPLQGALSTHVYNSREAASGGDSAGGGGCGCY